MPDCTEIIPAACTALAIANCIIERDCELIDLSPVNLLGLDGMLAADLGTLIDFSLEIHGMNLCIIAGMTEAFIKAGCPIPWSDDFPTAPTMPNLSECLDEFASVLEETETKLGYLSTALDIEFDETGMPTKIRKLL